MLNIVFVGGLGLAFLILKLQDHVFLIGRHSIHLDGDDTRWLMVIPLALCLAAISGGYVEQAANGFWTPGDWRSSGWFVALNEGLVVVAAPLMAGASIWSVWRKHHRRSHEPVDPKPGTPPEDRLERPADSEQRGADDAPRGTLWR